ncbi:hypothetical protein ACB092_04G033000 [Castanea dentata]
MNAMAMPVYLVGASLTPLIKLLVEELNEVSEFRFQRQLRSLGRELRLMLAVLDHIESLEGPDEAMKGWAENAREVVRFVEDMIDSFVFKRAKTSGAKTLKRSALYFNEIFLGYKLSPKSLISEKMGEEKKVEMEEEKEMGRVQILPLPTFKLSTKKIRHQILNVRKHRGDSEELEVTISREENAILVSKTIISSFLEQVKQVKQCLSDLLKHMEAARELDEREKVWWEWVRKICITAKDFLTSFRSPPSQYSEESVVIGFDDQVNEMKERILAHDEPNLCVISIVGTEGSGKNALATSIYNDYTARFDICARVSISEKHSAEDILEEIRKKVKGKRSIKEELRGKSYLIVMDNISMAGIWDDLRDAFPDESNRSRIVITTRDMAVPPHADSRIFQYKLHLLSTDESWTLFTNTFQKEVPKEKEKLVREMLRSCGGLSLAIVKLGKLLSEKVPTKLTNTEWSTVLDKLKKDKEESEISGEGPWSEILDKGPWSEISDKVSRKLPLELKGCLNYFLLFPEGFDIPARRLIKLWIAEGFLRLGRGDDSPEQFAERYLMELIDQNMVQATEKKPNGKVRSCRLPVALRKLLLEAMEKVSKGQVNTISKSSSKPSNTSFNQIHGDNSAIATLQASYRKSLSFMSFDYREGSQPGDEIGNFLQRCISCRCFLLLRVLDLERVFRPQLPKVLSKLVLLRYLGLRWTYLESLPSSISNLLKLQTLDVKHTYIGTLPRSIWKMQRLRHLYLSESYRSRFGPRPRGVSSTELQTLWGAFVDEKSPVKDGLDTLINLRKLGVACRCMSNQKDEMSLQLEAVAEWIQKLEHLQSLRLKSHDLNNQPWDLHLQTLLGHTNLSSVYFLGRLKLQLSSLNFQRTLLRLPCQHQH